MRGQLHTYNGETNNLRGWGKKLGLHAKAIKYRIENWPLEQALSFPRLSKTNEEKYCRKCNNWLKFNDFHKRNATKSGVATYCKKCTVELSIDSRYKHRYGISSKDKKDMLIAQNNKCAICNKEMSVSCIDHDHTTKVVRGLLCIKCNAMLGHIECNEIEIKTIENYLNRHKRFPLKEDEL